MITEPTELQVVHHADGEEMGAYERLLGDAMAGDPTLFAREDAVEAAWAIVEPILGSGTPAHEYEPGSWGPPEAAALTAEIGGGACPACGWGGTQGGSSAAGGGRAGRGAPPDPVRPAWCPPIWRRQPGSQGV